MAFVVCDFKRTESSEKLIRDLKRFFPDAEFAADGDKITGESSLSHFTYLCGVQQSVVCAELGKAAEIRLDKMAMHAGIIAPCDGSPLGCVRITKQ